MKKLILQIFFSILCLNLVQAQDQFYYYKDQKLPLKVTGQNLYLLTSMNSKDLLQAKFNGRATVEAFRKDIYQQRLIKTYRSSDELMSNPNNSFALIKFNNVLSNEELNKEIEQLKADPLILNVSKGFQNPYQELVYATNYVWVGLKTEQDIMKLSQELVTMDYGIVGQNPFMPEWVMIAPKSKNAIDRVSAANKLAETNLFNAVEPELMGLPKKGCVNDALFANQWGFSNTGQNGGTVGIDIRACAAWSLTTGSNNVDIAIIDEGVENTHPDLSPNLQSTGYDAVSGTTPNVVYGPHGTSCAGIAAASGGNSLGVAGVAYNADLFGVSLEFAVSTTWAMFADGFNWARINGAEVMSNSWGWNNPSGLFDAAVTNALTLGRGGLGCVVVFCTMNANGSIGYPQNSNAAIINVGAISPCAQRKNPSSCDGENWWGSNFGPELDLMAPGVLITTTDLQGAMGYNNSAGVAGNYTAGFNGTSSACPAVSGAAALVLSVNPCLTHTQVQQILKRTSRKIGSYVYGGVLADGSWNNEMGHGLLDAEAAVRMAGTRYLQNITVSGTSTYKGWFVSAGYNVNPFLTNGNFVTNSSANVTIQALNEIDFRTGCDLRGTVDAQILNPGSCTTW
jgi:serine protease